MYIIGTLGRRVASDARLVETTEYPADVDWWLADAVHEPRRDRTGLNLMMVAREADRIVGWIYLTNVDEYARSAEIGYCVRPHAHGQGFATGALVAVSRWALTAGGLHPRGRRPTRCRRSRPARRRDLARTARSLRREVRGGRDLKLADCAWYPAPAPPGPPRARSR
jgi:GNAT superfamily N-acetyltransferase